MIYIRTKSPPVDVCKLVFIADFSVVSAASLIHFYNTAEGYTGWDCEILQVFTEPTACVHGFTN